MASAPAVVLGTVKLTVDGGVPISATLANGSAQFTLVQPPPGQHTLLVSYPPQGNFDQSSTVASLTVTPTALIPTAVLFSISVSIRTHLAFVSVLVQNQGDPSAGPPTGNVLLQTDAGVPQSQPLVSGSALFAVSGGGFHTLLASYPAQGKFAGSANTTGVNL